MVLYGSPSLVPRPRFPTAADGLHHRYVESGSGVLYKFLSSDYIILTFQRREECSYVMYE